MSTAQRKGGAGQGNPPKSRSRKYTAHRDRPPCNCARCRELTRQADIRRGELLAIFARLDSLEMDVEARWS